jgi:hypothetical protein
LLAFGAARGDFEANIYQRSESTTILPVGNICDKHQAPFRGAAASLSRGYDLVASKPLRTDSVKRGSRISLWTWEIISLASCMRLVFFTTKTFLERFVNHFLVELNSGVRSIFDAINASSNTV